LPVTVELMVDS